MCARERERERERERQREREKRKKTGPQCRYDRLPTEKAETDMLWHFIGP